MKSPPPVLPGIDWQGMTKYVKVEIIESWNWGCPACGQKNYYREGNCRKCNRERVRKRFGTGPRGGEKAGWFMKIDWPTKHANELVLLKER
jgi:hypothetical protein